MEKNVRNATGFKGELVHSGMGWRVKGTWFEGGIAAILGCLIVGHLVMDAMDPKASYVILASSSSAKGLTKTLLEG